MHKIKIEDMFSGKLASDFNDMNITAHFGEGSEAMAVYLMPSDTWLTHVLYKHGEKYFLYYGSLPFNSFKKLFIDWRERNQANIDILAYAYYKEYNPLENYDKYSEIRTDYEGQEKNEMLKGSTMTTSEEGYELNELKRSGKEKTTLHNGGTENSTKSSASPYDGSVDIHGETVWKDTDLSVTTSTQMADDTNTVEYGSDGTTRKDENKRSFSDDRATKVTGSGTDTDTKSFVDRADTVTEHTHGQIGVTANYQLIQGELGVRLESLAHKLIDTFIREYCAYME